MFQNRSSLRLIHSVLSGHALVAEQATIGRDVHDELRATHDGWRPMDGPAIGERFVSTKCYRSHPKAGFVCRQTSERRLPDHFHEIRGSSYMNRLRKGRQSVQTHTNFVMKFAPHPTLQTSSVPESFLLLDLLRILQVFSFSKHTTRSDSGPGVVPRPKPRKVHSSVESSRRSFFCRRTTVTVFRTDFPFRREKCAGATS